MRGLELNFWHSGSPTNTGYGKGEYVAWCSQFLPHTTEAVLKHRNPIGCGLYTNFKFWKNKWNAEKMKNCSYKREIKNFSKMKTPAADSFVVVCLFGGCTHWLSKLSPDYSGTKHCEN